MSDNRAPLASGRAAHADDGVRGKLSSNGCALMEEEGFFRLCLTFDVRGGLRLAARRPLDGGVRALARLCDYLVEDVQ